MARTLFSRVGGKQNPPITTSNPCSGCVMLWSRSSRDWCLKIRLMAELKFHLQPCSSCYENAIASSPTSMPTISITLSFGKFPCPRLLVRQLAITYAIQPWPVPTSRMRQLLPPRLSMCCTTFQSITAWVNMSVMHWPFEILYGLFSQAFKVFWAGRIKCLRSMSCIASLRRRVWRMLPLTRLLIRSELLCPRMPWLRDMVARRAGEMPSQTEMKRRRQSVADFSINQIIPMSKITNIHTHQLQSLYRLIRSPHTFQTDSKASRSGFMPLAWSPASSGGISCS